MNYGMVVGAGLLAGATTCAVTQGGLLVGLIARQRKGQTARSTRAAEDLTPVGGFLLGKLVSHTGAGFVLGAIGGAFGYNPRLGAAAQLLAGAVIIMLGLSALGVPGFSQLRFAPPASWLNVVRRSTRSTSATAPFLLGLAVLLVPCGVTISMEILAASSGSAWTGAAIMALFVIGTAPMFTLYGYLSQRLRYGTALSTALAALVVAFGVITVNAGLVAAGSPYSAQALKARLSGPATVSSAVTPAPTMSVAPGQAQIVTVVATNSGYEPRDINAIAGAPLTLRFTTRGVQSCIRATTAPTLGKQVVLPESGSADLDLGALPVGDYPISCSMGMYTATLHVRS